MLSVVIAVVSLAFPAPSGAQASKAATSGYVVKVEGSTVYLDLGQAAGAEAGRGFEIFTEGEELKHPVTGASLGRVQNVLASGRITQVQPQFSVGTVDKSEGLKTGQRARLAAAAPVAPTPAPPAAPAAANAPGSAPAPGAGAAQRGPRAKIAVVDYVIRGLALGDFTGGGQTEMALLSPKGVHIYSYPQTDGKPKAEWMAPGVAPRTLSLEAADLDGDGRAELFLSLFSETMGRLETSILKVSTAGVLAKTGETPFLMRSLQDDTGKIILVGQQLNDDVTFPFSGIYTVEYKDGKYFLGKTSIPHKRADWLWGFTRAELDGRGALLYLTSNDHLRVQFDGGYFKTREGFGQTPVRLRWPAKDGGKLLEFHPRMRVAKLGGKTYVYAVRNNSMLGSLSEPFGLFNSGEIIRMSWNGVALENDWKGELGGYSTAFELFPSVNEPRDLVLSVSGTSGKSAIWVFEP